MNFDFGMVNRDTWFSDSNLMGKGNNKISHMLNHKFCFRMWKYIDFTKKAMFLYSFYFR